MEKRFFHSPKFHFENSYRSKKASWLELFYDLIYVASFIQLGNSFSNDVSLVRLLQCLVVFIPLWITWSSFSFFNSRYTVDDFLHRLLIFLHMFCVGAMGISIRDLEYGHLLPFTLSFSCSLFITSLLYFRAYIQIKQAREEAKYWGTIFLATSIFWMLSLLLGKFYFIGWFVCFFIILLSPSNLKINQILSSFPYDQEHLSERYGLLTIIVLGESFVKVLTELGQVGFGLNQILIASYALLLTCSIWWIYFDDVADAELVDGRLNFSSWLFGHIPLQFSLIIVGVAIKKIIAFDFFATLPVKYAFTLSIALATTLFSTALLDSVTHRASSELKNAMRVNVRIFSGVIILLLGTLSQGFIQIWFLSLLLLVFVFQILFDIFYHPYKVDHHYLEYSSKSYVRGEESNIKKAAMKAPVIKGLPNDFKKTLYFSFMEASWGKVIVGVVIYYLSTNLFFAALYMQVDHPLNDSNAHSFLDAFFFSVQTMSTIGYGQLSPSGTYANSIVVIEAIFGLASVAFLTGLLFQKISRPNSQIIFSKYLLYNHFNGMPSLNFRIGNARGNDIVEASISVSALFDEVTVEGQSIRRVKDLKLQRKNSPFFNLTWNVIHIIDSESPFYNLDPMDSNLIGIMVTVTGYDGTYSDTVYSRYLYDLEDLVKDQYYKDILHQLEDGRVLIDFSRFHDLK